MRPSVSLLFILLAACLAACSADADAPMDAPPAQGSLTQMEGAFGDLHMFTYIPANLPSQAPLVVALHGCTQSADEYTKAGWNALADQHGFAVVYPEQPAQDRCFTWYDPAHTTRGEGQSAWIVEMVDRVIEEHDLDADRVFVTGASAGGAMTAVLLATYPDRFAAGAIIAGLPYRCADDVFDAFACADTPRDLPADQWTRLVLDAADHKTASSPRVIIWHGTADATVHPGNADALAAQWRGVHALLDADAETTATDARTTITYRDGRGTPAVVTHLLDGFGHGIPIAAAEGCGTPGAFLLDVGVCSSRESADFFGLLED